MNPQDEKLAPRKHDGTCHFACDCREAGFSEMKRERNDLRSALTEAERTIAELKAERDTYKSGWLELKAGVAELRDKVDRYDMAQALACATAEAFKRDRDALRAKLNSYTNLGVTPERLRQALDNEDTLRSKLSVAVSAMERVRAWLNQTSCSTCDPSVGFLCDSCSAHNDITEALAACKGEKP